MSKIVFAGAYAQISMNVIVGGVHTDPDGNTFSAVMDVRPSSVPTITRNGVGRYMMTFAVDPELVAGDSGRVTVSMVIGGVTQTPYDLDFVVIAATDQVDVDDIPATLAEMAQRPRVVQAGTERIEEHSLKDQIEFQRYQNQQAAAADSVVPIRRFRQVHGRP